MYESLLFVHSWTRWIVLLSAVYLLAVCLRGGKWTNHHAHLAWAFDQVLNYQVLFGLVLWFAVSPITHAAFLHPRSILETPLSWFWTLQHPLTMIAALVVFQIGKARANKNPIVSRFRTYAITVGISLTLILSAVPWPFLSYGRALIRGF